MYLDYSCAGLWGIYDIYMGYTYTNKTTIIKILLANTGSFIINTQIPYNAYYQFNHSLWHFINAYKSYYVSKYIGISLTNLH